MGGWEYIFGTEYIELVRKKLSSNSTESKAIAAYAGLTLRVICWSKTKYLRICSIAMLKKTLTQIFLMLEDKGKPGYYCIVMTDLLT